MVILPALGLYAFSNLSNEGAVDDDMLVRWCDEAEDKKGNVGVECRRCLSHCWAFDRGIRSNNFMSKGNKQEVYCKTYRSYSTQIPIFSLLTLVF
jgi:hypothetical protein